MFSALRDGCVHAGSLHCQWYEKRRKVGDWINIRGTMILLGTGNSGGRAVGFGRASDTEYRSFPGQGDQEEQALTVTGQG